MFAPTINLDYYPANWHSPRDGATPQAIVAHGTAGTDSRRYLQRGGERPDGSDRKVSIHALIQKDGTIYRMVDDERVANHAGGVVLSNGMLSSRLTIGDRTYRGAQVNRYTLGFELENLQNGLDPYPDVQLLAMGWQINAWRQRYGPLPVTRHATIDPGRRSDPAGLTVAAIELWAKRAAAEVTSKSYRVKAKSGANVRAGRSTSAKVLTVLGPGDVWAGYVTPGARISVPGFGTSNEWICDATGRCVWRGLLDEDTPHAAD